MTNALQMTRRMMLAGAADTLKATNRAPVDISKLQREKVELVKPPFVHAHTEKAEGDPKIKEFTLTIQEKKMILDKEGTEINAMTFDGSVPGPLMVVHQDDYVELTLVNPDTNTMQHNIDFHAATGGLGGGALTVVNPGESTVLRFKATKAGVFVYHCAPPGMVPWHVTSGMNGAIMVLPRGGAHGRTRKAARLRQGLLRRRAGLLHPQGRERQVQEVRQPR
ncbi:copper-containing nitrite reductase [Rhizobium leguminosarum]|nr:copper-containing nitrite reductase [Rhizobium leguminosarum]